MTDSSLKAYTLPEFQEVLRTRLFEIAETIQEHVRAVTQDSYVVESSAHIAAILNSKGKCVRGFATYHMYRAAGGNDKDKILQAAAAIEIFHLFALVHDDVIDRANERRGIPTVEAYTKNWLQKHDAIGDLTHAATSQAILWGDYLLALSQHLLQECAFAPELQAAGQRCYYAMFTDVVIGQILDVEMLTKRYASREEVDTKTLLKTAYYTFVYPMRLGAAFAGAQNGLMSFAEEFGKDLGMAFQIQDDLFDLTLSEAEIHKPVLNDVRSGQHTIFSDYLVKEGEQRYKDGFGKYFGREFSEDDFENVRALFRESGAIEYGSGRMKEYFTKARGRIDIAPLQTEDKAVWYSLIDLVENRKS